MPLLIFFSVLILAVFTALVYKLYNPKPEKNIQQAQDQASTLLEKAAEEIKLLQTKTTEQIQRFQDSFSENEKRFNLQLQKSEKTISIAEERIIQKEKQNELLSDQLTSDNNEILKLETEKQNLQEEIVPLLSKITGETTDKIKQYLLDNLANDLELAYELRLNKVLDDTKEHSPILAKNLLVEAIQRFSAPTSVEKKSLVIPINRDETKLRIIGKNAEIITFLEDELGVDIVFDDSKEGGISVSHFELVKKHIARETILKLIKDRVIDLERAKRRLIEATTETKLQLREIGERVVKKLNLEYRKFPVEFKETLGRLKYRTSYGQNILKHCFEVGFFTLILGNELDLNEEICKIGGFFHDLGKAIDQEDGRPHDILTKEILEKTGLFSWEEIHAAWTHHDSVPIETAEALLVKAGDAISAGRPGARQETIEKYLARVMAIESIANSFQGVNKTYAISGGRELRVLVDPKKLSDENLSEMAKNIAGTIEANVAYPGQIKINVIRRVQSNRTIKEKNKAN